MTKLLLTHFIFCPMKWRPHSCGCLLVTHCWWSGTLPGRLQHGVIGKRKINGPRGPEDILFIFLIAWSSWLRVRESAGGKQGKSENQKTVNSRKGEWVRIWNYSLLWLILKVCSNWRQGANFTMCLHDLQAHILNAKLLRSEQIHCLLGLYGTWKGHQNSSVDSDHRDSLRLAVKKASYVWILTPYTRNNHKDLLKNTLAQLYPFFW